MVEHKVFISSTFDDLKKYRSTVQNAVRQLGAIDISMENFGARDVRPKDECIRLISEEADSFVGIYAHRYGHIPQNDKRSIIEAEYDASGSIERFIYFVNDDQPWQKKFIDRGRNEKMLAAFKARLQDSHICKRFSTEDELAASVASDLGRYFLRKTLRSVSPDSPAQNSQDRTNEWSPEEWNEHRYGLYENHRNIFLVHSLSPSKKIGQLYDIFIYLVRHKSNSYDDIQYAEFFLGPHWNNKIFRVDNGQGPIGIKASAYGEFLCTCRVVFDDGEQLFIDRYINFHS